MSKVPCGRFELGDSLVVNDGKLDLAPGAGGGLPTGEAPYQQLVTDGTGKAMWMDFIRVDFLVRDTGIVCSFTYDKVCNLLQKGPIQGYIYGSGFGCYSILYAVQNEHWVEFMFVSPDSGAMSFYYLEDGTITQNKPAV